jgi:hypothetical protein
MNEYSVLKGGSDPRTSLRKRRKAQPLSLTPSLQEQATDVVGDA